VQVQRIRRKSQGGISIKPTPNFLKGNPPDVRARNPQVFDIGVKHRIVDTDNGGGIRLIAIRGIQAVVKFGQVIYLNPISVIDFSVIVNYYFVALTLCIKLDATFRHRNDGELLLLGAGEK
jgi:hypothetical protein